MDFVFLDTSVFEENNFLEGTKINSFLKLAVDGEITILISKITVNELKKRIENRTKESETLFAAFKKKAYVLKNDPDLRKYFIDIDFNLFKAKINTLIDTTFNQNGVIVLDYQIIGTGNIFEKYFSNKFPFNSTKKKYEFPDAFVLQALEEWATQHNEKVIIFSNDDDFLNTKNDKFIVIEEYEDYLDKIFNKIEDRKKQNRIGKALRIYKEKERKIKEEIEIWIENQIEDESFYYKIFSADVHRINVEKLTTQIVNVRLSDYSEVEIILEIDIKIQYKIDITIDDITSGYYDDEEREWHYTEVEEKNFEDTTIIKAEIILDIPQAGEEFMEAELYEINNGQDLEIKETFNS